MELKSQADARVSRWYWVAHEARCCAFALAIICLLEAFLFNYRFWLALLSVAEVESCRFTPSAMRMALLFLLFVLCRLFGPWSFLYKKELDFSRFGQRVGASVLCVVLCIGIVVFGGVSNQHEWLNRGAVYEEGIQAVQDGNQYNHLADSILAGRLSLDLPESSVLASMDNPYDPALRMELNAEVHDPIYWDYAYYEGSYYCYFGILPCLLTFVPFKAITGCDLGTDYVVSLFACAVVVMAFLLLNKCRDVYCRQLSFGSYIVGVLLFVFSCGVLEQAFLPRIYPVPILSGLFFAMTGCFFWLKAKCIIRGEGDGKGHCVRCLLLGSLFMASTMACRPQFIVGCLLAFPIFWEEIRARKFFSKEGLGRTVATILPFFVVALPVCCYNYVRFGSPFDFGASYNLTGGDMTSYVLDPLKVSIQTLEYLFTPFMLAQGFPWIVPVNESFLADTILRTNEPFYAGFVFLTPAALILLAFVLPWGRRVLRGLGGLSFVMVSLALCLMVLDSYASGVNMRYFTDFAWLILVPSILAWWRIAVLRAEYAGRVSALMAFLSFAGFGMYLWTFLGTSRFGAIAYSAPALFEAVRGVFLL